MFGFFFVVAMNRRVDKALLCVLIEKSADVSVWFWESKWPLSDAFEVLSSPSFVLLLLAERICVSLLRTSASGAPLCNKTQRRTRCLLHQWHAQKRRGRPRHCNESVSLSSTNTPVSLFYTWSLMGRCAEKNVHNAFRNFKLNWFVNDVKCFLRFSQVMRLIGR